MPNNGTAKTKSAPKRVWWGVAILSVIMVVASLAFYIPRPFSRSGSQLPAATHLLRVGGGQSPDATLAGLTTTATPMTYELSGVHTEAQQANGLSNTSQLAPNQGMLFINDTMAERCFWMQDMNYSLDIIWLDSGKKVVHIEEAVSPSTYPKTYCAEAQYVIELLAGQVDKSGITVGQVLSF